MTCAAFRLSPFNPGDAFDIFAHSTSRSYISQEMSNQGVLCLVINYHRRQHFLRFKQAVIIYFSFFTLPIPQLLKDKRKKQRSLQFIHIPYCSLLNRQTEWIGNGTLQTLLLANSLDPGETPSNSTSHQVRDYFEL